MTNGIHIATVARSVSAACVSLLAFTAGAATPAKETFVDFDIPHSQQAYPRSINDHVDVTGSYEKKSGASGGFLRKRNGMIVLFDVSKATGSSEGTIPLDINTRGQIVGEYFGKNSSYGFLREPTGEVIPIAVGGAKGTSISRISETGISVGYYQDENFVYRGLIRSPDGTLTTVNAPGAGHDLLQGTQIYGVNSAGDVVGDYIDSASVYHGFIRSAVGSFTSFDCSGAGTGLAEGTTALDVNDSGEIVGIYFDNVDVRHGFIRQAGGSIVAIDGPQANDTYISGINFKGEAVGVYRDHGFVEHGLVRKASGELVPFDDPNAGSKKYEGTFGAAINRKNVITGFYTDASGDHGFIRTR